jgi:hypothetical protein
MRKEEIKPGRELARKIQTCIYKEPPGEAFTGEV